MGTLFSTPEQTNGISPEVIKKLQRLHDFSIGKIKKFTTPGPKIESSHYDELLSTEFTTDSMKNPIIKIKETIKGILDTPIAKNENKKNDNETLNLELKKYIDKEFTPESSLNIETDTDKKPSIAVPSPVKKTSGESLSLINEYNNFIDTPIKFIHSGGKKRYSQYNPTKEGNNNPIKDTLSATKKLHGFIRNDGKFSPTSSKEISSKILSATSSEHKIEKTPNPPRHKTFRLVKQNQNLPETPQKGGFLTQEKENIIKNDLLNKINDKKKLSASSPIPTLKTYSATSPLPDNMKSTLNHNGIEYLKKFNHVGGKSKNKKEKKEKVPEEIEKIEENEVEEFNEEEFPDETGEEELEEELEEEEETNNEETTEQEGGMTSSEEKMEPFYESSSIEEYYRRISKK